MRKTLFLIVTMFCTYTASCQETEKILSDLEIIRIIQNLERNTNEFSYYTYSKNESNTLNLIEFDKKITVDTLLNNKDQLSPIFINQRISNVNHDKYDNHFDSHILSNKSSDKKIEIFFNNLQEKHIDLFTKEKEIKILDNYHPNPLHVKNIHLYKYTIIELNEDKKKIEFNGNRTNEYLLNGSFIVSNNKVLKTIEIKSKIKNTYIKQEFGVDNDSIHVLKDEILYTDLLDLKPINFKSIVVNRNTSFYNYSFKKFHHSTKWKNEYKSNFYDAENKLFNEQPKFDSIYQSIDSLKSNFYYQAISNSLYAASTRNIKFPKFEIVNILSLINYNRVEGTRFQIGGKTNFSENDNWMLEGYSAYGTNDNKFKHAYNLSFLLNNDFRLITSLGYRDDIDFVGLHLSPTINILGKNNFTNSFLFSKNSTTFLTLRKNKKFTIEVSPWKNITFSTDFNQNEFQSASPDFSIAYLNDQNKIENHVNQYEINHSISLSPWRNTYGSGVEVEEIYKGQYKFFLNYSMGLKGLTNQDFDYKRVQLLLFYPLQLNKWINVNLTTEIGKTFGKVPLSLMHIFPANLTYVGQSNTFNLLNYYEFIADEYVTLNIENNFKGLFFSKIPWIKKFNLTEHLGFKTAWGDISQENIDINKSSIVYNAPNKNAYIEYYFGIGNIFKFLRIDLNVRGNYFDHPNAQKFNIKVVVGKQF